MISRSLTITRVGHRAWLCVLRCVYIKTVILSIFAGFLQLLSQLTTVGEISPQAFEGDPCDFLECTLNVGCN